VGGVRFGLFFLMQRDPHWSEQAVYEAELAQMELAEGLGFESVWIAEHHFSDYGLCPVPPVLAAHVAARTHTLRVGMGVSLLPLYNPVMLAEQLAVLDQVSGGRLDVGIGRGGAGPEYDAFGASVEQSRDRIGEGIALMRRCWSGETFSFDGRFTTVPELRVTPRPRQQPHPPLFVAANSPESNLVAARLGLPTLSSFFVPADELRRRRLAYREEAAAAGFDATTIDDAERRCWGMRCVHVSPDAATAVAAAQGPFMAYQERLSARAERRSRLPHARLRPFDEYLDLGLAFFGSPDQIADGLGRYIEETRYERVMLLMALAGLPRADTLRSMELFAAKVTPQLVAMQPA
jgi:alkanesulfonate monooxygenase SsuD/methylene tetrahydromethanopterin reductase-like flavin-dependent oxidoreductase (luciferase family)